MSSGWMKDELHLCWWCNGRENLIKNFFIVGSSVELIKSHSSWRWHNLKWKLNEPRIRVVMTCRAFSITRKKWGKFSWMNRTLCDFCLTAKFISGLADTRKFNLKPLNSKLELRRHSKRLSDIPRRMRWQIGGRTNWNSMQACEQFDVECGEIKLNRSLKFRIYSSVMTIPRLHHDPHLRRKMEQREKVD